MRRGTSLYLDLIRFIAAFLVFVDHYSGHNLTGGLLYQLAPFGAEAVVVFFVLSGYVIAYATDARERSAGVYMVNRAARIYSVALPALVITFLLDLIGRSIKPDLYLAMPAFQPSGEIWQFLSGLLFVNQLWSVNEEIGSNLPYWSLGYEIWYYAIFGVALFASGRWRIIGTITLLLIVGPTIASMFPLWLLGWFAYRVTSSRGPCHNMPKLFSACCFFGSILAWVGYEIWVGRHQRPFGLAPHFLNRSQLAQDYIIGLLFTINLVGVATISPLFEQLSKRLTAAIRWAAGATFTLYLFHMPILLVVAAVLPWRADSMSMRVTLFVVPLLSVFAIAELTERRKTLGRALFTRLLPRATPVQAVIASSKIAVRS